MKNKIIILILSLIIINGCATILTKGEAFPKMYKEKPVSILVLPPINESTAADAKEYYSTTIAEPLSFVGYYVFPIEIVNEVLKQEGIYDTELIVNLDPSKFKEYFDPRFSSVPISIAISLSNFKQCLIAFFDSSSLSLFVP